MDWVEGKEYLSHFEFAFLLQLCYIDHNRPIELEVIKQHSRLEIRRVLSEDIRAILSGKVGSKVLLLLDGYDEYRIGVNEDIDAAIRNGLGNCQIIVSSRPGDHLQSIKHLFDAEAKILGFSKENVEKCASQYLGRSESSTNLLAQCARNPAITGLLHIPIILLMICAIYNTESSIPDSITQLIQTVVHMTISRTTLKLFGKTASEIDNLDVLLCKLGKVAWSALQRQSLLMKVVSLIS